MHILDQLVTFCAFLLMLFSPCLSAYNVTLSWDRMDAAYYRFEASVERLLGPMYVVEANLCIRPVRFTLPIAAPHDAEPMLPQPVTQPVPPPVAQPVAQPVPPPVPPPVAQPVPVAFPIAA